MISQSANKYDVPSIAQIGRDAESDAYERVPIEDFGKNVLSKLGWQEGKAIGRASGNGKVVQPIEYMPRQHRLGLGAKPLSKEQIKKLGSDGTFDSETLSKRLGVT